MTEKNTARETKEYLEKIQETIRKSEELLKTAQEKINETRQKSAELGIDYDKLSALDIHDIQGLPPDLKAILTDDQDNWEKDFREWLDSNGTQNPDTIRQDRMAKLGALTHRYRL